MFTSCAIQNSYYTLYAITHATPSFWDQRASLVVMYLATYHLQGILGVDAVCAPNELTLH